MRNPLKSYTRAFHWIFVSSSFPTIERNRNSDLRVADYEFETLFLLRFCRLPTQMEIDKVSRERFFRDEFYCRLLAWIRRLSFISSPTRAISPLTVEKPPRRGDGIAVSSFHRGKPRFVRFIAPASILSVVPLTSQNFSKIPDSDRGNTCVENSGTFFHSCVSPLNHGHRPRDTSTRPTTEIVEKSLLFAASAKFRHDRFR